MIDPNAVAVLQCIEANLDAKVAPHLSDPMALSTIATLRHLLRHVAERILHEGQALSDDIAALRDLLGAVDGDLGAGLQDVLGRSFRNAGSYPDLISLGAEAGALRAALQDVLLALQAAEGEGGLSPTHAALRARIHVYLAEQIAAETRLNQTAFVGKGPRR